MYAGNNQQQLIYDQGMVQPNVYGQPTLVVPVIVEPRNDAPTDWNTGLCGCLGDIPSCLIGWFLPCVLYGQNNDAVNKGGVCAPCCAYMCCGPCCPCLIGGPFRTSVREKYRIAGEISSDCLVHWCCPLCALTQEAREINYRQFNQAGNY